MTADPSRRPRARRPWLATTGLTGVAVAAVAAVGISGLVTSGSGGGGTEGVGSGSSAGAGIVGLGRTATVSLSTFTSCEGVKDYFVRNALPLVGPYGLGGMVGLERMAATGGVPMAASEAAPAAKDASNQGATSAGGTNVQVAGVDEADSSKRIGDLLLTVSQGATPALKVIRTTGRTGAVIGTLATKDWYPSSLLVDGTTALLLGQAPPPATADGSTTGGDAKIMGLIYRPMTRIAQVDLSDPARPKVVRTLDVAGGVSGARLVDGVVRVAIASPPGGMPFVAPQFPNDGSQLSEEQARTLNEKATAANKDVVRNASVEDWLPTYTLTGPDGATSTGSLVACSDVAAPTKFSGLSTLALISTDLRAGGLTSWRSAGVVASDATMYATADRTYLATSPWNLVTPMAAGEAMGVSTPTRTQVHVFDSGGRDAVRYLGGGDVEGTLLNQFSMDEWKGDLRIATTTQPSFDAGPMPMAAVGGDVAVSSDTAPATKAPQQVSQSQVTVLRLDGDRLTQVGRVGGLGRNERIYSVRFIGPVGYVVTFRQIDPLYTLDLSDPTRPAVAGELKIQGFSSYLHPAGDGLILGIGQDATTQGRTTGLQLSLFDVSNAATPRRISQVKLPDTYSDAENDHHAFTFADDLVLIPFLRQDAFVTLQPAAEQAPRAGGPTSGVLAIRVQGRRIGTPTALTFPVPSENGNGSRGSSGSSGSSGDGPVPPVAPEYFVVQALRTYVDSGAIWTVTTNGLGVHDEATLARLGYVTF